MLEMRSAVQAYAWDACDGELDREDVAFLAVRVITGCAVDSADRTVRKGSGIKICGVKRASFIPQANGVLAGHFLSPDRCNAGAPPPGTLNVAHLPSCRHAPPIGQARPGVLYFRTKVLMEAIFPEDSLSSRAEDEAHQPLSFGG